MELEEEFIHSKVGLFCIVHGFFYYLSIVEFFNVPFPCIIVLVEGFDLKEKPIQTFLKEIRAVRKNPVCYGSFLTRIPWGRFEGVHLPLIDSLKPTFTI